MQVIVGNQLRIKNPSEQLLTWCKQQLILSNPEYIKKKRMGFWTGNTPEKLYLFQWDGGTLVLPFGCLRTVTGMMDGRDSVKLDASYEEYDWYGEDMVLNNEQAKQLADYAVKKKVYNWDNVERVVATALMHENKVVINADW